MSINTVLLIGGLYHLGFVLFHLMFWKIFNWKRELRLLNVINRGVMQILNLCLTFVFFIFAYISIIHGHELLTTGIGRSLLVFISIFWFLRAVEQVVYFKLKKGRSIVLFITFILGMMIYLYVFLQSNGAGI